MQPTIPKPCLLLRPPLRLEWTTFYPLHDTARPTVCVALAVYLVTLAAYIRHSWTTVRRWSLRLPSEGMPCNSASSGYTRCLLSQCLQPACPVTPGCSHGGAKWCSGAAIPLSPVQDPASVHLSLLGVSRLPSIRHEAAINSAPLPRSHNGDFLQKAEWNLKTWARNRRIVHACKHQGRAGLRPPVASPTLSPNYHGCIRGCIRAEHIRKLSDG